MLSKTFIEKYYLNISPINNFDLYPYTKEKYMDCLVPVALLRMKILKIDELCGRGLSKVRKKKTNTGYYAWPLSLLIVGNCFIFCLSAQRYRAQRYRISPLKQVTAKYGWIRNDREIS